MFGPGGGGNVLDKNLAVSAVLFLSVSVVLHVSVCIRGLICMYLSCFISIRLALF